MTMTANQRRYALSFVIPVYRGANTVATVVDAIATLRVEGGLCLLRRTLEVFAELGALEASTDYGGVDFRVAYRKSFVKGLSGMAVLGVGYASSIGSYQSAFAHATVLLGLSAEVN